MWRIPVVDIYVTGACNLGCGYCFGEADWRGGMQRSIFIKALEFARSVGATALELGGGEPLLYRDFVWATELARREGFDLILRTNALCLEEYRRFVCHNFRSVGISLDGDLATNNTMRPSKSKRVSALDKFEIPLREIAAIKEANPDIQVILASVATKFNLCGLIYLANILIDRGCFIDLWKVYQFVPNHFRAARNADNFAVGDEQFQSFAAELQRIAGLAFPILCRSAKQINGSCLVVDSRGDILLCGNRIGSVCQQADNSLNNFAINGSVFPIMENKVTTYRGLVVGEPNYA